MANNNITSNGAAPVQAAQTSPTPETDAAQFRVECANGDSAVVVSFLMARHLERRLIATLRALQMTEATLQRLAPDGSRATQGTRDVIAMAVAHAQDTRF